MRNKIKINWSKVAQWGLALAGFLLGGASTLITSKQIEMEVDERVSEVLADGEETDEDEEES